MLCIELFILDSEEETNKAMEKQVVLNSMLKSNDLLGEEISVTESSDKESKLDKFLI